MICVCVSDHGGCEKKIGKFVGSNQKKNVLLLLELCVSSLRRGHANLLCIVPILTDDPKVTRLVDIISI